MYIAVIGYGTVGSGVVEVLHKNHDSIVSKSTQKDLELKYILDLRDFPGDPNEDKFIKDFNIILNDDSVKIVVETMGGLHPAFEFVSSLLKAGKSVVTSNKELVAQKGYELLTLADENNVNFLFEASVGCGIPIIRHFAVPRGKLDRRNSRHLKRHYKLYTHYDDRAEYEL